MLSFLHHLIEPHAAILLFCWVFALAGGAYPSWRSDRSTPSFYAWGILWLIALVVTFLAWCFLVFSS